MNSDDMLCVVRSKVEHFNKAFENDFVEFGYGKVSPSESLRQGKMGERQQIVLKKKLEFATKSPKSKENTPLESTLVSKVSIPWPLLEVIVGYPNAKRWDYYNSMPGDSRHWEMAVQFIHWLNDSFAAYKWEEPMGWRRRIVENVPIQENSHDYGFFVMASVEHVLLNLKFEFTQCDLMYYRCKLVINQYNRQLELYKKRDQQLG
ncbi:hypothetical protein MRB53_026222 [Persea americana]|uniref:Uncharacterized protein n=1 Tax=Persea americana TaxID=3435 RepID=A0ACC2LI25_PERAE|nr:hypothetical protein MRB53_026222 [Persea americana]